MPSLMKHVKINYSIFAGCFVAAIIILFELYWLSCFPGEAEFQHPFLPIFAVVFVTISARISEFLANALKQPDNGLVTCFATGIIYSFCMSIGGLLNDMMYPNDCMVAFIGMHVPCEAPSFMGWLTIFEHQLIIFIPSVCIISLAYRVYDARNLKQTWEGKFAVFRNLRK